MPTRSSEATWNGNLQDGDGRMRFASGAFEGKYSFASRFENGTGTNPEELIGAALSGCYSMALANLMAEAGHEPERVHTTADVRLEVTDDGPSITRIDLHTEADVPGLDASTFQQHAEEAKNGCPVSNALAGTDIFLDASLAS